MHQNFFSRNDDWGVKNKLRKALIHRVDSNSYLTVTIICIDGLAKCVSVKTGLSQTEYTILINIYRKHVLCIHGFSVRKVVEIPTAGRREITLKVFREETHGSRTTRFTASVGEAGMAFFWALFPSFGRINLRVNSWKMSRTRTRDGLECSRRQIKTRRSRPRVIAGTRRDLFL